MKRIDIFKEMSAIIISLFMLLPFLWMFLSSFKTSSEIIQIPPTLFPKEFTLETYHYLFEQLNFWRYFVNSTIVAGSITLIVLFSSSITGFVFAKFHFKLKEALFLFILSSMMVPFAVIVIPLYLLVSNLGWIDTYIGLIIPMCISSFGIFLMRQFMEDIPNSFIEAARVDGASEWWIYIRVILPLSKPVASALGIFTFMGSWNNLFWPLMVITSPNMRTLTLGIASLQWEWGIRYDLVVTGAAISVIPVLIIYSIAHRNFIHGLALTGGLKY